MYSGKGSVFSGRTDIAVCIQIFDQKPCGKTWLLGGIFYQADIALRYGFGQIQLENFLTFQRNMGKRLRDKAHSEIAPYTGENQIGGFYFDIRVQAESVA